MHEKTRNSIIGAVSGAGSVLIMDGLRGSGTLGGTSMWLRVLLAGFVAGCLYMAVSTIIKLAGHTGATGPEGK